jgi:putative intracellular protease/amidase
MNPVRTTKRVAILVFDEVEELDFVGPLEVFGVTNRLKPGSIPTSSSEHPARKSTV